MSKCWFSGDQGQATWEMEGPAPKSHLPGTQPWCSVRAQRPEPPANPHVPAPHHLMPERKWGKIWALFFGPSAWGWPACRQEKGNLERFPLRMYQIMQERRRPQGMRLPAEKALPPPPPTTGPWGTPGWALPARVCKCLSRESQNTSGRPLGPPNCLHFLTSRASNNKGLTHTNTPTTWRTHSLPIA